VRYFVIWLNVFFGALFTYLFGMKFAVYSLVVLDLTMLMASCVKINTGRRQKTEVREQAPVFVPLKKDSYDRDPPDVPVAHLGLPPHILEEAKMERVQLQRHEATTFRGNTANAAFAQRRQSEPGYKLAGNSFEQRLIREKHRDNSIQSEIDRLMSEA